jgi:hypothetical protein
MMKSLMVGAAALAAVAVAAPDMASARPGGGAHFSGGGGAHFSGGGGARFSGGGAAFRSAAAPSFRSNAVASNHAAGFAAPSARFAANGAGRNWNGGQRWRRGFGYGGLALGLAAAPYYYNNYGYPYDDTYYDTYAYTDGYDPYADNNGYYVTEEQDPGCYVKRRVHTRYGWRLRTINVCG